MVANTTLDALDGVTLDQLATLAFLVVLGAAAVAGSGALTLRAVRFPAVDDAVARLLILCTTGVAACGALVFAAGFLPLLTPPGLSLLAIPGVVGCVTERRVIGGTLRDAAGEAAGAFRRCWWLAWPCLGFVALALVAGLRPPIATDELRYHWAAPVFWSDAHRWVTSPYWFTNGFHLGEVLYTPAAVFESSTAAHWLHTVMFVLLALGCAALARHFGAPGAPAAAAAAMIAVPAAAGQSWWTCNDVFAASFLVAACVAVVQRGGRSRLIVAGVLIAAGVSVKPLAVIAAPLVVALDWHRAARADEFELRGAVRDALVLAAPALVTGLAWFAYTQGFTGGWLQGDGIIVGRSGTPEYVRGTWRVPRSADLPAIPVLPFATGIIGNREPYGNRTGLILTMFGPLAAWVSWRTRDTLRRASVVLLAAGAAWFCVVSILVVRTRFLLGFFAVALALIVVLLERGRVRPLGGCALRPVHGRCAGRYRRHLALRAQIGVRRDRGYRVVWRHLICGAARCCWQEVRRTGYS